MIDFAKLSAPFPPEQVSWRIGATNGDHGLPLAYIDARDVMDRLDAVCSPAGWQCRYPTMGHVTICEIGICIEKQTDTWIWKADGAGQTDVEAEKGILSDAFKRAAVRWGVGRYLYGVQAPWVQIEQRGKSKIIKESEYPKLEALLARNAAGTQRPALPPQGADVAAGNKRWFEDQKLFLANCQSAEDVNGWVSRNAAHLKKLFLSDRPMWDALKDAKDVALDRVRAPV